MKIKILRAAPENGEQIEQLEQECWEVTTILPNQNGDISAESVLAAVRPDTALVSVMMVNNELGSI